MNKTQTLLKSKLIAGLLIIIPMIICGQTGQEKLIPPSPTTAKLNHLLDYPVSHFTGTTEINIPIYTIEEEDLHLPISICYNTSGVKVSDTNGLVGLGWVLKAGGMISRTIMGPPDEQTTFQSPLKIANEIIPNHSDHQYLAQLEEWGNCEYDIFSYSGSTIGGRFILQRNSSDLLVQKTIPYDPIKITQETYNNNLSYFEIADKNGVKYRYGKSKISGVVETETINSSSYDVTGWYLNEMVSAISPANTISFKYNSWIENRHIPAYNLYFDVNYYNNSPFNYPPGTIKNFPVIDQSSGYIYTGRKINEIIFRSGKIVFDMSSGMLDSITIYDKNNSLIKRIIFERTDFPNQSFRKKLTKVKFVNNINTVDATYEFDYIEDLGIPGTTNGIDYWGYYNGEESNTNLIPAMTIHEGVNSFDVGGANRNANETYMKQYALSGVKYPTGGEARFEYESNKYWSGGIKSAGGLRVSKITQIDENGGQNIKTYKYGTNESGYGELTVYPSNDYFSYRMDMLYNEGLQTKSYNRWICTSSPQIDLTPLGSPVIYPIVTEYIGNETQNTGKNEYMYEYGGQWITFHDVNNTSNSYMNKAYQVNWAPWKSGQLFSSSSFKKNGNSYDKIESRTNYYKIIKDEDIRGMKIYRFASLHDELITRPGEEEYFDTYFPGAIKSVYNYKDYYLKTGVKLLDYTIVQTYISNMPTIEQQTSYVYENVDHLLPSKIITLSSSGNSIMLVKKYPQDYPASAGLNVLIEKNIIAKPIDIRTYTGSKLISGTQTKYNDYGQPSDVYNFESLATDVLFEANNPYTFTHKMGLFYNTDNRVKKVTPDNDMSAYYLWGYNSKYPVAKIESASSTLAVDQMQAAIGNLSGGQDKTAIDTDITNIRNAINSYGAPGDMVTIFTYAPLIGMTSQTAPNGTTTYYEYDSFGRLQKTLNADKDITQRYTYHYSDGSPLPSAGLIIDIDNLSFGSGVESKTINITSNTGWNVKNLPSWLTTNSLVGTGNGSITLTSNQNTGNTQNGSFSIVTADGTINRSVSVTQTGGVQITAYNVTSDKPCIDELSSTLIKLSGSQVGVNYTLERSGQTVLTLSGNGSPLAWNVNAAGIYSVKGSNGSSNTNMTGSVEVNNILLGVSPLTYEFPSSGSNNKDFTITCCNNNWDFTPEVTWATVSKVGNTLTVTSTPNNTLSERIGTIEIKLGTQIKTISLSQKGCQMPSSYTLSASNNCPDTGESSIITLSGSESNCGYYLYLQTPSNPNKQYRGYVSGTGNSISWSNNTEAGSYTVQASNDCANVDMANPVIIQSNDIQTNPGGISYTEAGSAGGKEIVQVISCRSDWDFVKPLNFNWVQVTKTQTTLELICDPNNSATPRSGTITVTSGMKSYYLEITQDGCTLPTTYEVTAENSCIDAGGTTAIRLSGSQTNTNYSLYRSGSLVSSQPGNGSALWWYGNTAGTYTIKGTNNCGTSDMTGYLEVTNNFITCPPPSNEFPPTQGSQNFTVSSCSDIWNFAENEDWLWATKSGNTLTLNYSENTSLLSRTAIIELSSMGAKTTITVTQSPAANLSSACDNMLFESIYSSQTCNVTSNISWDISSKPSWVNVNPPFGSGNSSIKITCDANMFLNERNGEVILSGGGKAWTIQLSQLGKPSLSVSPGNANFPQSGGAQTFTVSSAEEWTVNLPGPVDWLYVEPYTGYANNDFVINCSSNTTTSSRSIEILVREITSGTQYPILISQDPMKTLTVSPSSLSYSFLGGNKTITVNSNTNWNVSYSGCVSGVSTTSGSGSQDITISCGNNTGAARTGSVTISGGGITRTVSVSQAGGVIFNVSPSYIEVTGYNQEYISISSTGSWTVEFDYMGPNQYLALFDLNYNPIGGMGYGSQDLIVKISPIYAGMPAWQMGPARIIFTDTMSGEIQTVMVNEFL